MGVLKCLCGPEGALNKLPVLISKHPFFISLFLSFLFIYIFFPFGPYVSFCYMWTLRGFLCNWKRTGNELMASVVLL